MPVSAIMDFSRSRTLVSRVASAVRVALTALIKAPAVVHFHLEAISATSATSQLDTF